MAREAIPRQSAFAKATADRDRNDGTFGRQWYQDAHFGGVSSLQLT
jgi:hypothetical protein